MRAKWDEVHYSDGATYGERTIERALETVDEVYESERDSEDRSPLPLLSETSRESGSHPEEPTAAATRDGESVYLEERYRLLQQKVQSQAATISERSPT